MYPAAAQLIWSLMPPVPIIQDHYDVVQVDGIWLHRKGIVLIAVAGSHVIAWRVPGARPAWPGVYHGAYRDSQDAGV